MNNSIKLGFDEYMNKLKKENPKKIKWLIRERINQDIGIPTRNSGEYILKTREEEEYDNINFIRQLRASGFSNKKECNKIQNTHNKNPYDDEYIEEKIKEQQKLLTYVLEEFKYKNNTDFTDKKNITDFLSSIEDYIVWEILNSDKIVSKRRKQIANFHMSNLNNK